MTHIPTRQNINLGKETEKGRRVKTDTRIGLKHKRQGEETEADRHINTHSDMTNEYKKRKRDKKTD